MKIPLNRFLFFFRFLIEFEFSILNFLEKGGENFFASPFVISFENLTFNPSAELRALIVILAASFDFIRALNLNARPAISYEL